MEDSRSRCALMQSGRPGADEHNAVRPNDWSPVIETSVIPHGTGQRYHIWSSAPGSVACASVARPSAIRSSETAGGSARLGAAQSYMASRLGIRLTAVAVRCRLPPSADAKIRLCAWHCEEETRRILKLGRKRAADLTRTDVRRPRVEKVRRRRRRRRTGRVRFDFTPHCQSVNILSPQALSRFHSRTV